VPRFLLSEALRGEGAWLRNAKMERFMERYHPLLELAPRDVVARAITREGIGLAGEILPVYLDMRHVTGLNLRERFPGISAFLDGYGLSLARDLVPVRPAAHYLMGGVKTDVHGRTSLKRLYAAGEVACTGVHGANRLASNSLLEGLVFGARAAAEMREETALTGRPAPLPTEPARNHHGSTTQQNSVGDLASAIQHTMWQKAGLLRDKEGLESALQDLSDISSVMPDAETRPAVELRSLLTVGELIVRSALAREESRGAHFRNDFPQRDDEKYRKHSVIHRTSAVEFVDN
jgi:L-aspartate oxidase